MTDSRPVQLVVCVKWTDLRPVVDPLQGNTVPQTHGEGFSEADRAALEVALLLGEHWGAPTTLVALGPADADDALRDLAATGVERVVRIASRVDLPSDRVAAQLAGTIARVVGDDDVVVVCGDASADRGSGSVPAFLAHELGAAQALGLIQAVAEGATVGDAPSAGIAALRRLDGGRRERLSVAAPAVLSVEGGAGELRRASLAASLAARDLEIEVVPPAGSKEPETVLLSPWRPRARVLPPPTGDHALQRIVALTGALVDRTPPRTVVLEPAAAADEILDQLRAWGYLGDGAAVDGAALDDETPDDAAPDGAETRTVQADVPAATE